MRISVRVVPKSSRSALEKQPDGSFKAWLVSPPEKGEANVELIELLARHFGVRKRQVAIASGAKSRDKQIDIL